MTGYVDSARIGALGSIMRLRRTWIATIMALGLLFAQIVTAAHACSTLALPPAHESSAMPADCAQSSVRIDSTIKVCVSHCDSGAQVDSHADIPVPMIAPQSVLIIRAADVHPRVAGDKPLSSAQRAPPLPLALSSRLLI